MGRLLRWLWAAPLVLLTLWATILVLPLLGINWIAPVGPVPCPSIPMADDVADRGESYAERIGRLEARARRDIGDHPERSTFMKYMQEKGVTCGDEEHFPSSRFDPRPSSQIRCVRVVPRGCPSRFGHWPYLFPATVIDVVAIYRPSSKPAQQVNYSLAASAAP